MTNFSMGSCFVYYVFYAIKLLANETILLCLCLFFSLCLKLFKQFHYQTKVLNFILTFAIPTVVTIALANELIETTPLATAKIIKV